jgi:hypothetical protein
VGHQVELRDGGAPPAFRATPGQVRKRQRNRCSRPGGFPGHHTQLSRGSGDTIPGMFRCVESDRPPAPGYATMNNGLRTSPRLSLLPPTWGRDQGPQFPPPNPHPLPSSLFLSLLPSKSRAAVADPSCNRMPGWTITVIRSFPNQNKASQLNVRPPKRRRPELGVYDPKPTALDYRRYRRQLRTVSIEPIAARDNVRESRNEVSAEVRRSKLPKRRMPPIAVLSFCKSKETRRSVSKWVFCNQAAQPA